MPEKGPWGKAPEHAPKTLEMMRTECRDSLLDYARARAKELQVDYTVELGDATASGRLLRITHGDADAFGRELEEAGRRAKELYPSEVHPLVTYTPASREVVILV